TADELVTRLIAERGYPTGDYDDQLANLSVEHAQTLSHYRDAHAISQRSQNGEASTEDLRQALVHYRALFADLLGTDPLKTSPSPTPKPPTTPAHGATDPRPTHAETSTEPASTEPASTAPTSTAPTSTAPTSTDPDRDVAGSRPDATRS